MSHKNQPSPAPRQGTAAQERQVLGSVAVESPEAYFIDNSDVFRGEELMDT